MIFLFWHSSFTVASHFISLSRKIKKNDDDEREKKINLNCVGKFYGQFGINEASQSCHENNSNIQFQVFEAFAVYQHVNLIPNDSSWITNDYCFLLRILLLKIKVTECQRPFFIFTPNEPLKAKNGSRKKLRKQNCAKNLYSSTCKLTWKGG